MGTLYYIICQDCPDILDLYKFHGWRVVASDAQLDEDILAKERKELFRYLESDDAGNVAGRYWKSWVGSAFRILAFMTVHNGHRITIVDERSDLVKATVLEKIAGLKEPDIEYCMCSHHFRTHMDMGYSWGDKDVRRLGSCSLCLCEQFASQIKDA